MTLRGLFGYILLAIAVISLVAGAITGFSVYQVHALSHVSTASAIWEGVAAAGLTFLAWAGIGAVGWVGLVAIVVAVLVTVSALKNRKR